MMNTPVKRSFFIVSIFILLLPSTSFAVISSANPSSDLDMFSMNMKDLTVTETLRYGRELYRKGDYPEAVNVFKNILRKDCPNRLAQYHLQKIAQSGPDFAYLTDYLKQLPCEQYNFKDEDFLPAAFYFEKDNDLLLEQLVAYNQRYRNNKTSLAAKISEYNTIAEQLERRTREMNEALNTHSKMNAETVAELSSRLALAKNDAQSMNDQISELNKALEQAALEQKRTRERQKKAATLPQRKIVEKPKTVPARITPPAVPSAAEELTTLQAKFANIQQRLQLIESSIAEKNRQILDLRENLETVKQ